VHLVLRSSLVTIDPAPFHDNSTVSVAFVMPDEAVGCAAVAGEWHGVGKHTRPEDGLAVTRSDSPWNVYGAQDEERDAVIGGEESEGDADGGKSGGTCIHVEVSMKKGGWR